MQRPLSDALLSVHENIYNADSGVVDRPPTGRPQEVIAFDIFGQPVTTVWRPVRVSSSDFGTMKTQLEAYFAPPTMIDSAESFHGQSWYPSDSAFNVFNHTVGRKVQNAVMSQFTMTEDSRNRSLDLIIDGRHISEGLKQQSSGSQLNIFDTELSGRAFGTELGIEVSNPLETNGASEAQNPYDNDAFNHHRIAVTVDGETTYASTAQGSSKPNDHYLLKRIFDRIKHGLLMEHLDDLMVYA